MTAHILKNVQLFAGGINLTSFNNKLELAAEVEEKECTTFGSYDATTNTVWREYIGGLAKAKLGASGPNAYAEDSVDETTFAALGGFGAISACPHGATYGDLAWLTYALQGNYKQLGQVGEIAPWEAMWSSSAPLVRGISAQTLGGLCDDLFVPRIQGHRMYTVGTNKYYGAEWVVRVIGSADAD